MVCVLDENLVRVVEPDQLSAEHFVYAEHTHPISASLFLQDSAMGITADESGEIRLWHAPNCPRSDMLLGCDTKIDSAEMTFKIHRQLEWSEDVFSEASLYAPEREGIGKRFAFAIKRRGNTHVLEHVIDLGRQLESFEEAWKTEANRIHGCQSQVWLHMQMQDDKLSIKGTSDAAIVCATAPAPHGGMLTKASAVAIAWVGSLPFD